MLLYKPDELADRKLCYIQCMSFRPFEATLNDTCLIAGWLGGQSCSFLPLGAHSAGQAGFVSHNDCKMIYPVKLLAWPAVW